LDRLQPDRSERRRLQGRSGEQLLHRLLKTGRCYLGQAETALQPGEPRDCILQWRIDQQGVQHPRFESIPSATFFFRLEGLWYIDSKTGECGRLEQAPPGELLDKLFALSEGLAPEDVRDFNRTLSERFPDSELPPPQRLPIVEQKAVRPVACLRFTTRSLETSAGTEALDLLLLSFDYNGLRFSGDLASQRFDGERVLRVQRNPELEQAGVERLLSAGFERKLLWNRGIEDERLHFHADADTWFDFQLGLLPQLKQQGWRIEFEAGFRHRLVQVESWHGRLEPQAKHDWFSVSLGIQVDGEYINLLPALVAWLRSASPAFQRDWTARGPLIVPLADGGNVPIPFSRVQHILDTLFELVQRGALDDEGRLPLSRNQLARLAELTEEDDAPAISWSGEQDLLTLVKHLQGVDRKAKVTPPKGLQARLRDYQQQGLDWLQFLREYRLAGVLADDMGLGKTVQTLAHLLLEQEQGRMDRPSLVVAPTSLMVNWRREARQFAPDLRVLPLHGPARHERFREIAEYDLVITSYPLLGRDRERLLEEEFHLLILDEAQTIKNPKTQASRVVRELNARHRLCLTGTPLENHLGELWSLFDFLLPGLLGSEKLFQRVMRTPIERDGDEAAAERLARRLRPFMLRRTKQAVLRELPPKTEIIRSVELEGGQRELYESVRLAMHEHVREAIAESGWGGSHIMVLDALLKLRQVCCDPRLVKLEEARQVEGSAKLELLMEMLPEMIEEGRRVLLFSQFTGMLGLIETAVQEAGIDYVKLTGQTRDRALPVDRFQNREVPLFLISLKAGGTGLNLTAADTVIHYDPWWNPAVERQAADRAHRIGQENPVFIYKLISEGTVEEKIQAMQVYKQALADSLFNQGESSGPGWTEENLDMLFGPRE
jgi:superfamily II DNA or RNA helicase